MTETWTVATFADIGYYSRDLDIDDFGWHQLLWPKFGHRQLCPEAATMAGIRPTMGTKPLWGFFFFFFFKRSSFLFIFFFFFGFSLKCLVGVKKIQKNWNKC
jgi:hypothetical protein